MFSTILVAIDDSAPARRALETAVRLARAEHSDLVLVAVRERLPLWDGTTTSEVRAELERRQDACHLALWAAESYVSALGLQIRTDLRAGRLAEELAAAAHQHQADLIVIGRSRPRRPFGPLFASKTERLCRRLEGPVMIVTAQPGTP